MFRDGRGVRGTGLGQSPKKCHFLGELPFPENCANRIFVWELGLSQVECECIK